MESLPSEILEKIFRDKILSHVDLSSLCRTCRRFQEVADTNDNWMIKFQLLYPKLFKHLPPSKVDKLTWRQELKKRLKIKGIVREEIYKMSEKNFTKTELSKSDFGTFDDILVQHNHDRSNVHLYITDELSVILKSGSENDDLTDKVWKMYISFVSDLSPKERVKNELGSSAFKFPSSVCSVLRPQESPAREARHPQT